MKSRVYASSVIWSPMADTRRCLPNQHLDLSQILQESKNRGLRPAEICEMLRNYQNFELTTDPPVRPPGGSLYLFDRKALRYFRKDGHRWRKKKDGKTVKEAHEKLKAGSVDVLQCYYAHGEDYANFQRRSYWMLDTHLQHIVLVHYRNVEEANSAARMFQTSFDSSPVQTSFASSPIQTSFASSPVRTSFASSPNRVDLSGQTLSTEFEDVGSRRDAGISSIEQPMLGSIFHNASLRPQKIGGFPESFRDPSSTWYGGPKFDHGDGLSVWHGMDSSTRNEHSMHAQNFFVEEPNGVDLITNKLTNSRVDVRSGVNDVTCEDRLTTNIDVQIVSAPSRREDQVPREHVFDVLHPQVQD
ncbi:calmodulin-binding transcription activator 3-like isoform X1 [Malus domestica]|uniref:calmodulin-binding transcription activator 3-like isoform X1 n=1 Tax=Malus domestica TaxID=3750 RepID=UPI003975DD4B